LSNRRKPAPKTHHLDRRADAIAEQGKEGGTADDLLSTPEVAGWFGVSKEFLENARHRGYGPPFIRIGPKRIRYRRGDCLQWLDQRTHRSTSEYGR
jgi:predicted DNA-binding transcriptional regulator AlpA